MLKDKEEERKPDANIEKTCGTRDRIIAAGSITEITEKRGVNIVKIFGMPVKITAKTPVAGSTAAIKSTAIAVFIRKEHAPIIATVVVMSSDTRISVISKTIAAFNKRGDCSFCVTLVNKTKRQFDFFCISRGPAS